MAPVALTSLRRSAMLQQTENAKRSLTIRKILALVRLKSSDRRLTRNASDGVFGVASVDPSLRPLQTAASVKALLFPVLTIDVLLECSCSECCVFQSLPVRR